MFFSKKFKPAGLYAGAAAFALIISGGAYKAGAQDSYMPPAQHQDPAAQQNPQQQASNITADQVHAYIKAEDAIRSVQAQYQEQATGMSDQNQLAALQKSMNKDIVKAVEASGLGVDEFNGIGAAIQSDPHVMAAYQKLRQQ